jgi:hypothetical protein
LAVGMEVDVLGDWLPVRYCHSVVYQCLVLGCVACGAAFVGFCAGVGAGAVWVAGPLVGPVAVYVWDR